MEKQKHRRGIFFLLVGVILILLAVGWYAYNLYEDKQAGEKAHQLLTEFDHQLNENSNVKDEDIPLETNQGENDTCIYVDGEVFCGKVMIDKLGIELPVYQDWDYAKLKTAPCRYTGSIDGNNMIIAAHNYQHHFGNLKALTAGDSIRFVDGRGTEYPFAVAEITTLDGTAVEDMASGEWDLTLFTCTKGGEQRVTIRCIRVD